MFIQALFAPGCNRDEWKCSNGECIPAEWRCDNVRYDCSDNSDEENCGIHIKDSPKQNFSFL